MTRNPLHHNAPTLGAYFVTEEQLAMLAIFSA